MLCWTRPFTSMDPPWEPGGSFKCKPSRGSRARTWSCFNPLLETERHRQKWLLTSVSPMIRSCSPEEGDSVLLYVGADVRSFWWQAFKKCGYLCIWRLTNFYNLALRYISRAGEMVQQTRHLLHSQEGRSLDPQNPLNARWVSARPDKFLKQNKQKRQVGRLY